MSQPDQLLDMIAELKSRRELPNCRKLLRASSAICSIPATSITWPRADAAKPSDPR